MAVPTFAMPAAIGLPSSCARKGVDARRRPCARKCRRRGTRSTVNACGTTSGGSGLAGEISAAFVAACAPKGVPYATAVRNFVKHAMEAYTRGYSLSALALELRGGGATARPLASDEAELRDVWLSLVYKTLRAVRFPSGGARSDAPPDHFDAFVRSVVAAKRNGSDLARIQLEHSVAGGGSDPRSPLESAILRQSTRLVVATLDVADEMDALPGSA